MKFLGQVPKANPIILPKYTNGHWLFPEQMGEGVGFIYVIRDNVLHRCYLGKKQFYGMGKLNKGEESNWKSYKSSSKTLAEHFKERPKYEFDFVCLEQYQTKGTLSYSETWSLCFVEAPTSKFWYNTLIEKVTWPVKEPITERHKTRLRQVMSWEALDE
jgi:hypothetical protein